MGYPACEVALRPLLSKVRKRFHRRAVCLPLRLRVGLAICGCRSKRGAKEKTWGHGDHCTDRCTARQTSNRGRTHLLTNSSMPLHDRLRQSAEWPGATPSGPFALLDGALRLSVARTKSQANERLARALSERAASPSHAREKTPRQSENSRTHR